MKKLKIIEIDSGLETHALRAAAEYWGYSVEVTWVGNSGQIARDFAESEADVLVLSCHGQAGTILLPELDPEIANQFPFQNCLTPDDVGQSLQVVYPVVLSTGCQTGTKELGDAFLAKGTKVFIAPKSFPEGDLVLKRSLDWIYELRGPVHDFREWAERVKQSATEFLVQF